MSYISAQSIRCRCLGWFAVLGFLGSATAGQVPRPSSADAGRPNPKIHRYREPDLHVEGFPVWLGKDAKLDRLVVLVEGFDVFNQRDAAAQIAAIAPIADQLAELGLDALIVDFRDSHPAPDELAPWLDRAVRAGARASGQPVVVAALSAGGIVARWALAAAEERGEPLPVHTLVLLDSPNRGARFSPALQALTTQYGGEKAQTALQCPYARAVLTCVPGSVEWRRIGAPGVSRKVPVRCVSDSSYHDAFFRRLRKLNGGGGYPKACRVVAVAQGSREERMDLKRPTPDLFRLWLPFGGWVCRAEPEDTAPGALLPRRMVNGFRLRMPLGIAGGYLRTVPTFISTESALDAGPGEKPPFDEWYARPDGQPRIGHDEMDPAAVAFVIRVLTRSFEGSANPVVGKLS